MPNNNVGPIKRTMNIFEEHGDEIIFLYMAGASLKSLGRTFSLNFITIRRFLVRTRTPIRKYLGKYLCCFWCKTQFYRMKCRMKHQEHTFCSTKCMGLYQSHNDVGENGRNWRGGKQSLQKCIRKMVEYSGWRKLIFQRDDYTCQECSTRGGVLVAHHIVPFAELLDEFMSTIDASRRSDIMSLARLFNKFWDTNNGTTLCAGCHASLHNEVKKSG